MTTKKSTTQDWIKVIQQSRLTVESESKDFYEDHVECPSCKAKHYALETHVPLQQDGGEVVKECANCGHKFKVTVTMMKPIYTVTRLPQEPD